MKTLRNTPRQFAWLSTREPWAEAYYRRKRAEGKSHSMALRALANIWVRITYAMWLKDRSHPSGISRRRVEPVPM